MRGDDRPSRYPPRGVWFGLFLASCALCAPLAAQVAPEDTTRGPGEPLVLTAERIAAWRTEEAQYLYLSGGASILQGTDGLRAAQAVCRIVKLQDAGASVYEADVYAEGNVRDTTRRGTPLESHRVRFRAPEVRMEPYGRGGVSSLPAPPRGLDLLRRSGLATPIQAAPKPGASAPGPPARCSLDLSPLSR